MKAGSAGIVFSILAVRLPVLALFTPGRGGHAETRLEQAAEKVRMWKTRSPARTLVTVRVESVTSKPAAFPGEVGGYAQPATRRSAPVNILWK